MISRPEVPTSAGTVLARVGALPDDGGVEVILALQTLVPVPPQPDGVPTPGPGPIDLRRLNPRAKLTAAFRASMRSAGEDASRLVIVPYEAGRLLEAHEVFYLPLGNLPMLQRLLRQVTVPAGIQIYDPGHDKERPRLSVVSLSQSRGATVHFLRSLSPQFRLMTGKFVAAVLGEGAYNRFEEEVLLFDRFVDALCVGEHVFIIRAAAFERMFGYLEELRALAGQTFDTVTAELHIAGLQLLRDNCTSDVNMMRKVASIASRMRSDPRHLAAMTMQRLLAFIDAHPQLASQVLVQGEGPARELVFESDLAGRWRILKLLDDDYLKSDLTEIDYEANSKSRL